MKASPQGFLVGDRNSERMNSERMVLTLTLLTYNALKMRNIKQRSHRKNWDHPTSL